MNMQQYERYKDSQDAWLGRVPAGWEVRRADFVIKSRKLQISDGDLENMDVYHYAIPTVQTTGAGAIEEGESINSNKLIINEPQVLVSKLNPRKATVTIAEPHDEYLTVASTEFVPLIPYDSEIRYLYYVWKSQKVTDRLSSFVQSVTRSHQRCEPAEITKIPWAWPTLNEQSCIADFLDRKTAEIDNLIAKKRRLLDLLAEKRTALITRAVTKGLNPDAPMKDSGIEWLGEIPAHWDVLAIKQVFDFQNNRRIPIAAAERRSLERTYPYYGASGIIDYVDDYIFDEDLMLVAEDGANLLSRSTPLAFVARGKYWVNNHAHILRNRFGLLDYWEMLLSVCDFTPFITGSAQPKLTKDRLGAIAIPCPPEKEQSDILKFLGPSFERDELARVLCKKAIERLEEYRSALITNAVTGQIKVA
jgi:type I restriction enzyme S subunit